MFLVVFKDWDSNTSENFSFAVVMHHSVFSHWLEFLTLWVMTLRYFSFDDCVPSCKSANTHLFGMDVFTVHMYIASKLSSSESSACTLCGGFVNASTTFTSSIVFTFVLCGFVRHLLVKCQYF